MMYRFDVLKLTKVLRLFDRGHFPILLLSTQMIQHYLRKTLETESVLALKKIDIQQKGLWMDCNLSINGY